MNDDTKLAIKFVIAIAIVSALLYLLERSGQEDCAALGGVRVRTAYSFECIDARRLEGRP